jgi:hypothetical protein
MTSSITFNVGAPTFGVRWLCHRSCGVSHATNFPFWNDAAIESSIPLKTKSFHKPSSNTFNVGAPTFFAAPPIASACVVANLQIGHPERTLRITAGLKTGHYNAASVHPAVSR